MTTKTVTPQLYDILRSHLKYGKDRLTGDWGVEIETETFDKYEYPSLKFWNCTRDNSLRDWGVEFVLKAPMNRLEFQSALVEFDACDKKYKFNRESVSTSVHVHMNLLNETLLTMANVCTLYAMFENLLIKFSGPDRLSNLFCLPMCDAEGIVDNIHGLLTSIARNNFRGMVLSPENVKYGALNPACLTTLGTLEFRSFRGEVDITIISKWVAILEKLKQYAKRAGVTPVTIMNEWEAKGFNFTRDVFGQYTDDLLVGDYKKMITPKQSLSYAAKFATATKDWSKFGVIKVKPVYKEKLKEELDAIAEDRFKVKFDELDFAHRLYIQEEHLRNNPYVRVVDAVADI